VYSDDCRRPIEERRSGGESEGSGRGGGDEGEEEKYE